MNRKLTPQYRRELNRARWGFVLWMIVLCAVMLAADRVRASELELYTSHGWQEQYAAMRPGMTYWPDTIRVEYPDGLAPLAKQAMWAWSQRTGKTFVDSGATASQGYSTSGRVTFVWRTLAEIRSITGNHNTGAATRRWTYNDTGHIAGAIIYLPSDRDPACLQHTILHELGHAIGITAHDGTKPHDVMYPVQISCEPVLTATDVRMAPYQDHVCHVELMVDGSLYVPIIAGKQAILRHQGGHVWRLERYADAAGQCVGAWAVGMDLMLSDIRGPDSEWQAQLIWIGADTWRLGWAE